jgi:RNA polymerase sigma-70 factor, ECF subfamily
MISNNPIPANAAVGSIPRDTLDEALIEHIAKRDAAAMRVLFTRHNARVYRFALRLVGNSVVAEEVTSAVFLDVWRKPANFGGRCQVSTWLLAVTRHKAIEAHRRRSTEQLDDDSSGKIADPSDDPETAMHKRQTSSILFNCLSKLSAAHREVVDLVYYHQKTIDEVAAITGLERNTVKTRMFYARNRLAEMLCAHGIATSAA